jgi:5'-nucleotidase
MRSGPLRAGPLRRAPPAAAAAARPARRFAVTAAAASAAGPARCLSILHFNDVYNIGEAPGGAEPVGGAARFAAAAAAYAAEAPLVLFSGDCLNPSLLSAFTQGAQMPPVLNALGIAAAVAGNHDFDHGAGVFAARAAECAFPWLLSNVLDASTGAPLAGARRSLLLDHAGVRVGLMGLVEREWLATIPSIDAERDLIYLDFVAEGAALAAELRAAGADLVVALTHMRAHNDARLAAGAPGVQLVLGGHDHGYAVAAAPPHGTLVVKSGTDFREMTLLRLEIPAAEAAAADASSNGNGNGSGAQTPALPPSIPPRPAAAWERVAVTRATPPCPAVAAIVARYDHLIDEQMGRPLGRAFTPLDARFDAVRSRETAAGNLLADVMRLGLDADVALVNAGTIRSDRVHAPGRLSMGDLVAMLPFLDELVVLELTGADLLAALEVGVSAWPAREGRFLQVSGVAFAFDPARPPGARVLPGSARVGGAAIDSLDEAGRARTFRVATKNYLRSGKDGFLALKEARVVVDGETAPRLATLALHLLTRTEELNAARRAGGGAEEGGGGGGGVACAVAGAGPGARLVPVARAPAPPAPCAHGLDALYYFDAASGLFGVAPAVEGRIVNVAPEVEEG